MIHILVHDKRDTVGVTVVEGIRAGQELTGWVMEDDSTIKVKALNDVPIGHKVATSEIKKGDTVIKYGFDIGKAVADIKVGEHAVVRGGDQEQARVDRSIRAQEVTRITRDSGSHP